MTGKTSVKQIDLTKLVVRYALGSDYENVMKISHGIYGGRDIIPAMYHTYLYDPTRHMYVAEYEGQVVGFAVCRIMDNETSFEGEAARVHPEFWSHGLFSAMRRLFVNKHILPRFPNLRVLTGVTVNPVFITSAPPGINIKTSTRSVVELGWKLPLSDVIYALSKYEMMIESALPYVFKDANKDVLLALFSNPAHPFRTKYIPDDIIIRDSQLFDMGYISNLHLLLQDRCNQRFVTYNGINNEMQSISFGTAIEADVSMEMMRYTIDYYGKSDVDLLKAHTMKHVSTIPAIFKKSKTAKNISVNIFTLNIAFNKAQLEELSKFTTDKLGFYGGGLPVPNVEQFLQIDKQHPLVHKSKM